MAVAEKNILDRAGKYNLSELNIISYQQVDNEPRFIDIKGITLTLSISEDIFSNKIGRAHVRTPVTRGSRMPSSA